MMFEFLLGFLAGAFAGAMGACMGLVVKSLILDATPAKPEPEDGG